MHLPFGEENRNLGWNLLPGGFVSPSRLGPEKVSSAVLSFVFFPAVENPTGLRSGFYLGVCAYYKDSGFQPLRGTTRSNHRVSPAAAGCQWISDSSRDLALVPGRPR